MRVLVVLSYDLPDVERIAAVLTAIDPPGTPHFDGEARVVPEPESVAAVLAYLDDDAGPIAAAGVTAPACDSHRELQHRDGKPPWCNACGWTHGRPAIGARKIGTPR